MRKKGGRSGKISRRSAIALIAGGGLAGLSSVGAFDQVEAGRRFSVNTASDEDALLAIDIPAGLNISVGSSEKLFTVKNQTSGRLSVQAESLEDWLEIESSVRPPNSTTVNQGAPVEISGTVSTGGSGSADVQITATDVGNASTESSVTIQLTRSIPINVESGDGKFVIGITNNNVELYEAANSGGDTVKKLFPTRGSSKSGGAVKAIGTIGSDIDGDGKPDLVAIKNKNQIMFIDEDGKLNLKTDSGNNGEDEGEGNDNNPESGGGFINLDSAKADTQKTTLATGSWNGYDIFYPSENHDKIYGIAQTGSGWETPEEIVAPGNGVNGILPPADIDNDGVDELVFADGSQHIRYVDKNLNITKVAGGGVGSSNNIGVGPVATIDGRTLMPTVDGSNNIKFLGPPQSGSGTVKKRAVFKGVDAAKSRITVADIDRDGEQEVVYLTNSDQKLRYIDNIDISGGSFDAYDVQYNGSSIKGEKKRGVV